MEPETMCVALLNPAPRLTEALPDPDRPDIYNAILEANDDREDPMPLCPDCRHIFHGEDGGWLFRDLCGTCELNRLDALIVALIKAKGKKATKKALKALKKLRKLS
jgi:hypothetical protein